MKRLFFGAFLMIISVGGILFAQQAVTIDEAITASAFEIEGRLTAGIKVVVLNFRSPSVRLSNYVIDEMMTELVRSRKLQVVDRANLELIRMEMAFQMSGDVSDASAQRIGQQLGAQSIISGSIEDMGSHQRVRFRVIAVETAAVQAMTSHNVRIDAQLNTLMRDAPGTSTRNNIGTSQHPKGLNFSAGQKVGASFLNPLLGLGSFAMGDWVGGLIIGGIQALGIGLLIHYELSYYEYEVRPNEWSGSSWVQEQDTWALLIGIPVYAVGAIYGFIRPWTYDVSLAKKRGTYLGFDSNPINNITLSPVFDKSGESRMALLYSASF